METRFKIHDFETKAGIVGVTMYVAEKGTDPFMHDYWQKVKFRTFKTVKEAKHWIRQEA